MHVFKNQCVSPGEPQRMRPGIPTKSNMASQEADTHIVTHRKLTKAHTLLLLYAHAIVSCKVSCRRTMAYVVCDQCNYEITTCQNNVELPKMGLNLRL